MLLTPGAACRTGGNGQKLAFFIVKLLIYCCISKIY